ncbi:hypothetical protein [Actinoplanes flavus]|uniref:Uncharacterized protein n=1 Tax=Actinoplanes flavus TaxID=2820290 RepID=A0ABS3UM81_9ACTN|nr:hypothetical protein [Actinoplanes flavus]MBO3739895.1 hypothetical protein [Actinoplanes flavus]
MISSTAVVLDRAATQPEIASLRVALSRRDWPACRELIEPAEPMAAAPPGSPHGVLIAEAHIEHIFGGDRDAVGYLSDPAVRAEIYGAAQRSIGHPDFRPGYGWVDALSTFAFLFTLLDDRRSAAAAFTALGDRATAFGWDRVGRDVESQIREARAWAYEGAS